MPDDTPTTARQRLFFGAVLVALGLSICLVATGVFKPDPRSVHAPMWLIGVIGGAFSMAGAALMMGAVVPGAGEDGSVPANAPLILRLAQISDGAQHHRCVGDYRDVGRIRPG